MSYTITQYVDRIAVIEDGRIKEIGTREHLLQQLDSVYAMYYKIQNCDHKNSDIIVSPPLPVLRQRECAGNGGSMMSEGSRTPESIMNENNSLSCSVEKKAPVFKLWKPSRPEILFLIVGMVGGIITGLLAPAEGFFLAKMTVSVFKYLNSYHGHCGPILNFAKAKMIRELKMMPFLFFFTYYRLYCLTMILT